MAIMQNLYHELKSSLAKDQRLRCAHERPICNADPAREFEGQSEVFARYKAALVVPLLNSGYCLGTISIYNIILISTPRIIFLSCNGLGNSWHRLFERQVVPTAWTQ